MGRPFHPQFAFKHHIPRSSDDLAELLYRDAVRCVYVANHPRHHVEAVRAALLAGKHVLCEKPLVTTLADFDQVTAAAQRNKVTIFEAFMYLHHPQTQTVLKMVREGELGEIQQINSWFHFYLPPERATNIRLNAGLDGGSLWDVGVYPNSAALSIAARSPWNARRREMWRRSACSCSR